MAYSEVMIYSEQTVYQKYTITTYRCEMCGFITLKKTATAINTNHNFTTIDHIIQECRRCQSTNKHEEVHVTISADIIPYDSLVKIIYKHNNFT